MNGSPSTPHTVLTPMATGKRSVPKLVNGRGTLPIDRRFGQVGDVDVGRMRIASGTTDPDRWLAYQSMLDDLVTLDRGDLLLALATGDESVERLWKLWKAQRLRTVPKVVTGTDSLSTALSAWLAKGVKRNGEPFSQGTAKHYRNALDQVLKCGKGTEMVKDLPRLVAAYRDQCIPKQNFVPFNRAKVACQSFARATEPDRQFSDLYQAIGKIDPLSAKRKRERNAISLGEAWILKNKLDALYPRSFYGQVMWCIALTGLRFPSEFRGEWGAEDGHVYIKGTKTAAAVRRVPRLDQNVHNLGFRSIAALRAALKKVSNDTVTPYDLRGTYRRFLTSAVKAGAIERSSSSFYFGHSRNVEEKYETFEFEANIPADTVALKKLVDEVKATTVLPPMPKRKTKPKSETVRKRPFARTPEWAEKRRATQAAYQARKDAAKALAASNEPE